MSLKNEILESSKDLRSSLDETDFHDLIQAFLSDAPEKLEEMASALRENRKSEFNRCAHALKGSIGLFGLEALRAICADLEKADTNESAGTRFEELARQCSLVFDALREIDGDIMHS